VNYSIGIVKTYTDFLEYNIIILSKYVFLSFKVNEQEWLTLRAILQNLPVGHRIIEDAAHPFELCSLILKSQYQKTDSAQCPPYFCYGTNWGNLFKGTLLRGFLRFGVKNVLKFKLNAFFRTQNTPRTSREGNQMIFSKEEQTIISFWRFFHEPKENLENQPDVFKLQSISILAFRSQTELIVVLENW